MLWTLFWYVKLICEITLRAKVSVWKWQKIEKNDWAYAIFTTFCSFSAHHCASRHNLLQTFQTPKFSSDQALNNDTKYRAFARIGAWQQRNPLRTLGSLFGHFAKFSNAFQGPKMQDLIETIMKFGFVMTVINARSALIITLKHWQNSHFLTYRYLSHFLANLAW